MAVRNMRYSETVPDGAVSVEEVHIEGLPSGGTGEIADGSVTKAKLAADVQASLGKADTALQSAPTKIQEGALVPGAGIDLARDPKSGVITASVKAKGVTAAMLADGTIPKAKAVADLAAGADAAAIVTGFNALLKSLRDAGFLTA